MAVDSEQPLKFGTYVLFRASTPGKAVCMAGDFYLDRTCKNSYLIIL